MIDHVPAEVCTVCGDVPFKPETARVLEQLLASVREPDASVPPYEIRLKLGGDRRRVAQLNS